MLRLRTTVTLSVLALLVGVAGTQWLSDQTGSGAELPVHAVVHRVVAQHSAHRKHPVSTLAATVTRTRYVSAPVTQARGGELAWMPVSMPVSSLPFAQMRGHDAGDLVLHLAVDGQGQVMQAALVQSSGDAVLDANALAIARRWRFAVPADHPQGFSGDLPLSFNSASAQFAQMR
jgi:protein TonB